METETLSSIDIRALELLGSGVTVGQTAAAIGVSESRIAQMLSEDDFAKRLAARRFDSLRKHNARDEQYDEIEDKLIAQLKQTLPMVMQPEKLARMLQIINAAKRRGASSPDNVLQKQTVIKLNLPIQIVNRFSVNAANQVTTVESEEGNQSMVTVQSGAMKTLVREHKQREEVSNEYLHIEHSRVKAASKFGL